MPDDSVLGDHDPYDLMDGEAARLATWFSGLDGPAWAAPSACEGWSVQDVLAHLGFGEEYNAACLDDDVATFFERYSSRGASDMNGFNALGVEDRRGRSAGEVLAEWRAGCARTRRELRQRDGGTIATGVGPYSARWQAWHLASELATHADDVGLPETTEEAPGRQAWRTRFALFALDEMKPDVEVATVAGRHLGQGRRCRAGARRPRAGRRRQRAAPAGVRHRSRPAERAERSRLTDNPSSFVPPRGATTRHAPQWPGYLRPPWRGRATRP